MTKTHLEGNEVSLAGELISAGENAPDSILVGAELNEIKPSDFQGKTVILNIFPSIDTGICQASVRRFNQEVANLDNTVVLCVSNDLPFAQTRFCGAEGLDRVITASAFRSDFGEAYGVKMTDSPLSGLLARSIVVIDPQGKVSYVQLADEIKTEPDYQAVLDHLNS